MNLERRIRVLNIAVLLQGISIIVLAIAQIVHVSR